MRGAQRISVRSVVRDEGCAASWIGVFHIHALSAFLARGRGLMDEEFADAWNDWYVSFLHSPGLREWWRPIRHTHHQSFVEHVEARLEAEDGPIPVHRLYSWFALPQEG